MLLFFPAVIHPGLGCISRVYFKHSGLFLNFLLVLSVASETCILTLDMLVWRMVYRSENTSFLLKYVLYEALKFVYRALSYGVNTQAE